MNALLEICFDPAMEQTGERRDVRRRLSDKILDAFNHAYSVGEVEIAKQLKSALALSQAQAGQPRELRQLDDPLGEAELWCAFVDARNRYQTACDENGGDSGTAPEALEAMKEAYRLWSRG